MLLPFGLRPFGKEVHYCEETNARRLVTLTCKLGAFFFDVFRPWPKEASQHVLNQTEYLHEQAIVDVWKIWLRHVQKHDRCCIFWKSGSLSQSCIYIFFQIADLHVHTVQPYNVYVIGGRQMY